LNIEGKSKRKIAIERERERQKHTSSYILAIEKREREIVRSVIR
jgi:hypothetical protein